MHVMRLMILNYVVNERRHFQKKKKKKPKNGSSSGRYVTRGERSRAMAMMTMVMTTAGVTDDDTLTEYERQRLAHVARNREYMERLGVLHLGSLVGAGGGSQQQPHQEKLSNNKRTTTSSMSRDKRARPTTTAEGEPVRRSSRLRRVAPENDGSAVDALEDEAAEGGSAGRKKLKAAAREEGRIATGPAGGGVTAGIWASEDAALEASRQWLEDARALMGVRDAAAAAVAVAAPSERKSAGFVTTNVVNDVAQAAWREEAIRRWGVGVPPAGDVADWEAWVRSRVGTPPPPSDLQLLQEYYAHDTWQLLVACVLMSRVSSWEVKHNTISAFFAKYPTPTAAIAANPDEVLDVIRPLGLFPTRMRSIVEVSAKLLGDKGPFDVGHQPPAKVYGVGEFGIDSFNVFCRGDLTFTPADKTLRSFVEWQKRHGGGGG